MKILFRTFVLGVVATLAGGALLFMYVYTPVTPRDPRVSIEKGMSLKQVVGLLSGQGIIEYPTLFRVYAKLAGKGGRIQAGEYLFEKAHSPKDVLERLVSGKVIPLRVSIIEGWNLKQIAGSLDALEFLKDPRGFRQEWLRLAEDPVFAGSLGIPAQSLEGYLFPETYHFPLNASPADFLKAFVKEFEKNYERALRDAPNPPLPKQQIVTLASIIEKESGVDAERPQVASVFYNRLGKKMPLQSDPTIIYGLQNFDGNIRKEDITNPHPYNTYVHAGLPPGPICNPGLASLKAAMSPAHTDYLYFVSKKDGTHYFSKSLEEHSEAVRKYQLNQ